MKKKYLFLSILSLTFSLSLLRTKSNDVEASVTKTLVNDISSTYSGNYYNSIDDTLEGEELFNSVHALINTGNNNQTYDQVKTAYKTTDVKANGKIWDMYSNYEYTYTTDMSGGFSKEGDGYNREHTVPQSWFNENMPMKGDIHHVLPTDGYVNNMRANYPHGDVSSVSKPPTGNGSKLGSCANPYYSGIVFEVIDEYKGDFARIYLYMACRYSDKLSSWNSAAHAVFQDSFPYLTNFAINQYVKWAIEDPVSEKEINRNEAVYKIQNNRNPFVDNPNWVLEIWGDNPYSPYDNTSSGGQGTSEEDPSTEQETFVSKLAFEINKSTTYDKLTYIADRPYVNGDQNVTLNGYEFSVKDNNFGFCIESFDPDYASKDTMQIRASSLAITNENPINDITKIEITYYNTYSTLEECVVKYGDENATEKTCVGDLEEAIDAGFSLTKTVSGTEKTFAVSEQKATYAFSSPSKYFSITGNTHAIYIKDIKVYVKDSQEIGGDISNPGDFSEFKNIKTTTSLTVNYTVTNGVGKINNSYMTYKATIPYQYVNTVGTKIGLLMVDGMANYTDYDTSSLSTLKSSLNGVVELDATVSGDTDKTLTYVNPITLDNRSTFYTVVAYADVGGTLYLASQTSYSAVIYASTLRKNYDSNSKEYMGLNLIIKRGW